MRQKFIRVDIRFSGKMVLKSRDKSMKRGRKSVLRTNYTSTTGPIFEVPFYFKIVLLYFR